MADKLNSFVRLLKSSLMIPARIVAALLVNLFQLLMVMLLLGLATGLAGWKLFSLRRALRRGTPLEQSPVPGRQR